MTPTTRRHPRANDRGAEHRRMNAEQLAAGLPQHIAATGLLQARARAQHRSRERAAERISNAGKRNLTFLAAPPDDKLLCEACERSAVLAGMSISEKAKQCKRAAWESHHDHRNRSTAAGV